MFLFVCGIGLVLPMKKSAVYAGAEYKHKTREANRCLSPSNFNLDGFSIKDVRSPIEGLIKRSVTLQ
jgi:hypothetical protein